MWMKMAAAVGQKKVLAKIWSRDKHDLRFHHSTYPDGSTTPCRLLNSKVHFFSCWIILNLRSYFRAIRHMARLGFFPTTLLCLGQHSNPCHSSWSDPVGPFDGRSTDWFTAPRGIFRMELALLASYILAMCFYKWTKINGAHTSWFKLPYITEHSN